MKSQFISELDGFLSDVNSTVIIMGATNRQNSIDDAILRRLTFKRAVGLPVAECRRVFD